VYGMVIFVGGGFGVLSMWRGGWMGGLFWSGGRVWGRGKGRKRRDPAPPPGPLPPRHPPHPPPRPHTPPPPPPPALVGASGPCWVNLSMVRCYNRSLDMAYLAYVLADSRDTPP